jgi:acyl-CoA-binding protein
MDVTELSMLLETMEPREVSEQEFTECVMKTKNMKSLPQEQQIMLYGLFKQYTVGDINIPQPDELDMIAKYKW